MKIITLRRDFDRSRFSRNFAGWYILSCEEKKEKKVELASRDKNRNLWNETIISGVKNAAHSSQWTRETRDSARFLRDPSSCKHEGAPPFSPSPAPFLSQLFSRSTPGEHIKAFAPRNFLLQIFLPRIEEPIVISARPISPQKYIYIYKQEILDLILVKILNDRQNEITLQNRYAVNRE